MRFNFVLLFVVACSFSWASLTPDEVLKKADAVRNPANSFMMEVSVESHNKKNSRFEVLTEGTQKTLIKTLAPERKIGRDLLMVKDNMWAFIPRLGRAERVNLGQKLSGEAANGDLSRMRWHGDYAPTILQETDKYWVLGLTALRKGLTYDKVKATIEKKTFYPLSAKYLTRSGKVLKKVSFRKFQTLAGAVRPTEILIQDAVREKKFSLLKILKMEVKKFSPHQFNLKRFQSS